MSITQAIPRPVASQRARPWGLMSVVLLAALVTSLAQSVVIPALSDIGRHFHATPSAAAWTLTAALLSASIATPVVGKLGDLYGRGRMLALVMALMSVGSIVCAVAGSIDVLIVGRVVQGVSGGVFPLAFGIVNDTLPRKRVAMGLSVVSASFGIGLAAGLPLGGVLASHVGLPWLFWIGLAAVPAALGAAVLVPASSPSTGPRPRLDLIGCGLLSAVLVTLLLAVSQASSWGWGSVSVIGLLVGGVVLLAVFVVVERRVAQPLVDMSVLARRPVAYTNLSTLLIGFATYSSLVLVPRLVETPSRLGYGFSTGITTAGVLLVPLGVAMVVLSPVAARLGARIGFRPLLGGGSAILTGGLVWLAVGHGQEWEIPAAAALIGIGMAFAYASMANLIVGAVDAEDVGIATGINTITRTVGGSFGSAVASAILASSTIAHTSIPRGSAYTATFLIVGAGGLVAALAALGIPRPGGRRHEPQAAAPSQATPSDSESIPPVQTPRQRAIASAGPARVLNQRERV